MVAVAAGLAVATAELVGIDAGHHKMETAELDHKQGIGLHVQNS